MAFTPIGEVRVPITLDGRDLEMLFNANAMCAYEQATGKFFLNTVSDLLKAMFPTGLTKEDLEDNTRMDKKVTSNVFEVLRRISLVDLRALLWSTVHQYDAKDNPVWPYTINQIGRMMKMQDILPVFTAFLKGQSANGPTSAELGESQAGSSTKSPSAATPPNTGVNGGERGIALPEDAFA